MLLRQGKKKRWTQNFNFCLLHYYALAKIKCMFYIQLHTKYNVYVVAIIFQLITESLKEMS